MKILVTGATGFTGSQVVRMLHQRGDEVYCFVRKSSDTTDLPSGKVYFIKGDLDEPASLQNALKGMDALVNIASLGFGHAPSIVDSALCAGVLRTIFISTTAIFTTLNAPSKKVRIAAEETIQQSRLHYTILRPTMIYGNSRDRNMCRLIYFLQRQRVIPILGNGQSLQQPVFVEDVAQAVIKCLDTNNTIGKVYNIPGAEPLKYNEVIDTISTLLNRKVFKLHLPYHPLVAGLQFIEKMSVRLPIKAEQILRLNENKMFSFDAAANDFGYLPRTFAQGIQEELLLI